MPPRRSRLRPGDPPRRRSRIRARNPERHALAWARQFGSGRRVEAIQRQPCVVPGCKGRSQNCHTYSRRTATWRDVFPACHAHHREQHQIGMQSFMAKYNIDPYARAAQLAELIPV
jgi:hypothetical protein